MYSNLWSLNQTQVLSVIFQISDIIYIKALFEIPKGVFVIEEVSIVR